MDDKGGGGVGEKDIAEKQLLSYADVFANIMNVGLFHGKEIIRPEELTDVPPQSTYKMEGKLREQERDVAKFWKNSELRLALLGLENQSQIDPAMPIRVIGYDGAAYRNELNADSVKLYPVLTVVLYFGWEQRWKKPRCLKDCFEIPEPLKPYISDYHINVVEVAWLPDDVIAQFSNPFRMVAEYFSQTRKNEDYHPSDEYVRHAKEVLDLLSLLTNDIRFKDASEKVREGASMTMRSILLDRLEEKARNKALAEGREEGRAEGRAEAARSLMESLNCTKEKAMELLKIPDDLRPKVLALL